MSRSTKNLAHSIDAHQLAMRCYYNQLPEIYRAKGRRRKEKEKSASNFEAAEQWKTAGSTTSLLRTTSRPFLVPKRQLSSVLDVISATSWSLYDNRNGQRAGNRENIPRQIASLTKMMTCLVVLEAVEEYGMSTDIRLTVTERATKMAGTSSRLAAGYEITLMDALYAMMLPSGNDAAWLLAQNIGLLIIYGRGRMRCRKGPHQYSEIESIDLTCYESTDKFVASFVRQMNRRAKQLNLSNTMFGNPHGMTIGQNTSTVIDLIQLSRYCTANPLFMKIASCIEHTGTLYKPSNEQQLKQSLVWRNTNSLLQKGWQGLKTGHTISAGGCFASYYQDVFIVVLNSATQASRFEDTLKLFEWHCSRVSR